MTIEDLHAELLANQDPAFAAFATKLGAPTPTRPYLGVRTPILRKLAKRIVRQEVPEAFILRLPHRYADEYLLHALLINEIKKPAALIAAINAYLPLVDTWGNCDALNPTLFKRCSAPCLENIPLWLRNPHSYAQRFGVVMLLRHFAKDGFSVEHLSWLAELPPAQEVDVAVAWYLAEALVCHPKEVLSAIEEPTFSPAIRLAAIQKARDSRRIPPDMKERLAALRKGIRG